MGVFAAVERSRLLLRDRKKGLQTQFGFQVTSNSATVTRRALDLVEFISKQGSWVVLYAPKQAAIHNLAISDHSVKTICFNSTN